MQNSVKMLKAKKKRLSHIALIMVLNDAFHAVPEVLFVLSFWGDLRAASAFISGSA